MDLLLTGFMLGDPGLEGPPLRDFASALAWIALETVLLACVVSIVFFFWISKRSFLW